VGKKFPKKHFLKFDDLKKNENIATKYCPFIFCILELEKPTRN
jgi:hypothetical protein